MLFVHILEWFVMANLLCIELALEQFERTERGPP